MPFCNEPVKEPEADKILDPLFVVRKMQVSKRGNL